MRWTDINEIAIELDEAHPDIDPMSIRFTELMGWVLELDGFDDDPKHCGERILEAIQMAWMEEKD
jgi:FeS assembly protein IscX